MKKKKSIFSKIKSRYDSRVGFRKLYSEEMLSGMSKDEKLFLRSKYLRELGVFSTLLLFSLLALLGVSLLGGGGSFDGNANYSSYKSEESRLAEDMDKIYGKGNWEYGIYQTNLDAYRVKVTLSDGSIVDHYYRVDGGNVYRLRLED